MSAASTSPGHERVVGLKLHQPNNWPGEHASPQSQQPSVSIKFFLARLCHSSPMNIVELDWSKVHHRRARRFTEEAERISNLKSEISNDFDLLCEPQCPLIVNHSFDTLNCMFRQSPHPNHCQRGVK